MDLDITGFVLAGGKSSRMGQDKGLLEFEHKTLVEYPIDTLKTLCHRVVILTSNPGYEKYGLEVIPDEAENQGPLGAIINGLLNSKTELNFFLTCDSPFVSRELLIELIKGIEGYQAIVPNDRKNMYPLTALYRRSSASRLMHWMNTRNLKVREAVTSLHLKQIEFKENNPIWSPKLFMNLNTFEDLAEAKKNL